MEWSINLNSNCQSAYERLGGGNMTLASFVHFHIPNSEGSEQMKEIHPYD